MTEQPLLNPLLSVDPDSAPFRLARTQPGEGACVSCYLDTRPGKTAVIGFLNRKAAQIRGLLRGVERFYFDTAIGALRAAIDAHWREGANGMALFSQGGLENRRLSVFHSATALDNRLVRHSMPELLPLLALHQREPSFDLLWVHDEKFRLIHVRPGWLTDSDIACDVHFADGHALYEHGGRAAGPHTIAADASWQLRTALSEPTLPLFIAGDPGLLPGIAGWLPPRAVDRLIGSIELTDPHASRDEVVSKVRGRIRGICGEAVIGLADALCTSDGRCGHAALGYRAAVDALAGDNVEAVVIAGWDHPGLGLPREAVIEITSIALERGVNVVLAESPRLLNAGGVACAYRQSAPDEMPAVQYGQDVGIERVA